jgi:hypothetical protein
MLLPVLQINIRKLRVVPVHQNVFPVTLHGYLGVVKAALLHGAATLVSEPSLLRL